MKAFYWIGSVAVVGIGFFIYILLGDTQKTIPKIKLSYFSSELEIAEAIEKRLQQEITPNQFFWIGVEPAREDQLNVLLEMKKQLEKTKPFKSVLLDQELQLKPEWREKLGVTDVVLVKENVKLVADKLAQLEKSNERYLLITAAIYSTPLLKQNQIHQMKALHPSLKPMTFSIGFFPITADHEKEMLFQCRTDDHSGVADWGCAVATKARFIRRKIDESNPKPWIGTMDLIGEQDYMLLLYKK